VPEADADGDMASFGQRDGARSEGRQAGPASLAPAEAPSAIAPTPVSRRAAANHVNADAGALPADRQLDDPVKFDTAPAAAAANPTPAAGMATQKADAPGTPADHAPSVLAALPQLPPSRLFGPPKNSARDWQVVPSSRPAARRVAQITPVTAPTAVAGHDQPQQDAAPAANPSRRTAQPEPSMPAAPDRYYPAPAEAPSAPSGFDIEHIEVRLLPPAPQLQTRPARQAGDAAAPLLRAAPPFGLRQS
jgi:hypothetical protein